MMDNFKNIESNIIPNLKKKKIEKSAKIIKEIIEVKFRLQDKIKEITKKLN